MTKQEIAQIKRRREIAQSDLDLSYFLEELQRKYKLTNVEMMLALQRQSNVALAALAVGKKKGSHTP